MFRSAFEGFGAIVLSADNETRFAAVVVAVPLPLLLALPWIAA
jgi:hypothetical protein